MSDHNKYKLSSYFHANWLICIKANGRKKERNGLKPNFLSDID